jgi:CHAT domain-containing protein
MRDSCADPRRDPKSEARGLYDIVIGDLRAELEQARRLAPGGKLTLVWLLQDGLRYVPMAALYDGEHYLVENYSNSVLLKSSEPGPGLDDFRALAAGTVHGGGADGLRALPGVADELGGLFYGENVAPQPGKMPARVLLDPDFTADSLRAGLYRHYPIVHIASHFVLKEDAKSSYLLLSSGVPLTLEALSDPREYPFGAVQLLTLSACNTAAHPLAVRTVGDGREIEDFVFGLLADQSGAHSVLASLYSVDDDSTDKLMQRFYRALRTKGTSKAEALRQAELSLLHGDVAPPAAPGSGAAARIGCAADYARPKFWAPFVLIGSWR